MNSAKNKFESVTYHCPMHPEVTYSNPGICPVCGISLEPLLTSKSQDNKEIATLKWRLALAVFFTLPMVLVQLFPSSIETYISKNEWVLIEFLFTTIVVWVAGWPLMAKGIQSYFSFKLNMFSLIALGVLIAYGFSLFKIFWFYIFQENIQDPFLNGLYFGPSAVITTLVLIGQLLEALALKKTEEQIESLVHLSPQVAHLIIHVGEERKIAVEDVRKGDLLRVKPGEVIPVDGEIKESQSWVNESMITGEAIPVFKRTGSIVLAGTLNGNSSFIMIANKLGSETLLASIIQLLATSRLTKAHLQTVADKIAALLIPLVLVIALFTGLIWILTGASLSVGISHAIAVLIIACPCALGLATPMSMVVGMGLGASQGILIKDAEALEQMEKVTTLIIDKAGTLTEGKPMLTKIFARFPFSELEVLKFASSVEQFSSHPLAQSIVMGAKLKQIPLLNASYFQSIEGKGVIADVEGTRVAAGNAQLLIDLSIDPSSLLPQALQWQKEGLTVSFIALEYRAIGLIAVADPIKFTAERAIQQLRRENIRIIMATGDSTEAALAVAKRLKIDEVHANALPQDKMALVHSLQKQGESIAMVGDGVNDAPALAQANVGIAMSLGPDVAIYNSGITLIKGDLCGVVRARILSKITMQNVRQNLLFAFVYNLIAIPLAAGVFYHYLHWSLTPIIASLAMMLSSLAVIGNSLRLKGHILYD